MNKFQIHIEKVLADLHTTVSLYLKLRDRFTQPILLESADSRAGSDTTSIIGLNPIATFKAKGNQATIHLPGEPKKEVNLINNQVLDLLNDFLEQTKNLADDQQLHAQNGLFGYMSFESVGYVEPKLKGMMDRDSRYKIPDISYSLYGIVILFDHFRHEISIVETSPQEEASKIPYIKSLFDGYNPGYYPFKADEAETSEISDQEYRDVVSNGKKHCRRGDVFQVVLSRPFERKFTGDEFNVYRRLRSVNPSPYLFYFDYGSFRLMGSSPESQLIIRQNKATISPIAGTYGRTGNDEGDRLQAEKLLADPKENAEHIMLVDLARNDLSRSARNLQVEAFRQTHFFSHLIHLVSEVTGDLPESYNPFDVLFDSFPAGTLSGAPKHKAMELINTYESTLRGFYGGCIGKIGFDGSLVHAILIRSMLSIDNKLVYRAGAGIVERYVEETELLEVNQKIAALRKAIDLASM